MTVVLDRVSGPIKECLCWCHTQAARGHAVGGWPSDCLFAFPCSEETGFINGPEVNIDGGGRLNIMAIGSHKELLGNKQGITS